MSGTPDAPAAVLHFVSPPPGLGPLTVFTLTGVTDELYSLRAVDAADVRLFVLDPRPFFPDYSPRVPQDVLGELGRRSRLCGRCGAVAVVDGLERCARVQVDQDGGQQVGGGLLAGVVGAHDDEPQKGMPMRALSDILWRERDVLELFAHRLEVERLLLDNERTRRLPLASREVAAVLDETRSAELGRAAEAEAAATWLDLPPGASLAQLAEAAPAPWREILLDHRTVLRELVEEITALAEPRADPSGPGGETFLHSLRERLHARVEHAAEPEAAGPDEPASTMADIEMADAALELQLEELGRKGAEERGHLLPPDLLHFLR